MNHEHRTCTAPSILAAVAILYCNTPWAVPTLDLGGLLHAQRLLQSGYQGQGARVGVISGGASSYATLAQHRILPADVAILGSHPDDEGDDEGDWMMQVVHQIAPRAKLAFCSAAEPAQTVDCARELVNHFHADIVVDDLNPLPIYEYPTPKAVGLAELAHEHPDVLFFTGAGNDGGGYYEGRWTPISLVVNGTPYLAQDFGQSLGKGSDPYDVFVLAPQSDTVVSLGTNANPSGADASCEEKSPEVRLTLFDTYGTVLKSTSSHCPLLSLRYRNPELQSRPVRVAVLLPAGSHPGRFALKLVTVRVGGGISPLALSYRTGGGAGNSATAAGLIAVAAVDPFSGWRDRYLYEPFANSGPQCLGYVQSGLARWTVLKEPQCFQQPALVVPDRTIVAVAGPNGERYEPFVGNSAAGPAAAGVAALLHSAHIPSERILELLEHTAIPQTDAEGWNPHYGYGLIDADAAAVAAGVLPAVRSQDNAQRSSDQTALSPTSPSVLRYRLFSEQARRGDRGALAMLNHAANSGDVEAQTSLAMYLHGVGNDTDAATWALAAAEQGAPAAQGFLGSMYNRGWGVPEDPRAAQSWWLRAARVGVANAMFNLGTNLAHGRGAPADPALGYALMRAASLRGLEFSPMNADIAEIRSRLDAQQLQAAETQAAHFAADPGTLPDP